MTGDEKATDAAIYRLSLVAPQPLAERIADVLGELCEDLTPAISMYERPGEPDWGIDAYFETPPDQAALEQELHLRFPDLRPSSLEIMPDIDWVSRVQSEFSPIRVGRYFIYGSHDRQHATDRPGDIEIEAGQAFGTAHHATTQGCLAALDKLFKRHRFKAILDLGTGTGLLAIAAARILRTLVLASDIDPIAVSIACENAALNGVGRLLRTVEADGLRQSVLRRQAPYDLLVANILAAPLKQMAPDIANSTCPGSHLILSGLLAEQSASIEARYRSFGFKLAGRFPIDEWMTLHLVRR